MRRREFVAGVLLAAALPPARAQQRQPVPVIGYLSGGAPGFSAPYVAAFREGVGERGFVEGQNVATEYRWAEGRYDRLPAFAAELVDQKVDVLVASGGDDALRAAKNATSTIPIVFTGGGDPVADGLVASLARPGGNLTGVSFFAVELSAKRFELISKLAPQARVIALLVNPKNSNTHHVVRDVQEAARTRDVKLVVLTASSEGDIDTAFELLARAGAQALIVDPDHFIDSRREQLVGLAARHNIPAIYGLRELAAAGGLMSYGVSLLSVYRQLGAYAGTVLKGADPAELPIQRPTKFELVINLKTAAVLGLTIPASILASAGEVIE